MSELGCWYWDVDLGFGIGFDGDLDLDGDLSWECDLVVDRAGERARRPFALLLRPKLRDRPRPTPIERVPRARARARLCLMQYHFIVI